MEYILETNNLEKKYKNFKAISDLNIHVKKGAIYGLIGKNGAGKTTLIRLICGLQNPTSGTYSIFGVKNTDKKILRERIGAIVETPSIYVNMSAKDNLLEQFKLIGLPNTEAIDELLKLVGLENTGNKKAKNFSLGMRQRLGIAMALAGNPDFLILSLGTNESHNRRYNSTLHYRQMEELVRELRARLPNVPILVTTPPGSYERQRTNRRRRSYVINPRTSTTVKTIERCADANGLAYWDMYNLLGGAKRACLNWQEAGLMRPDHIHFMPEGYKLQGELLGQALLKAYNNYVKSQ